MRINKKGFVATSVLYSLAAIIAAVIFLMMANMKTMRDINRSTASDLKNDLECINNGEIPNFSFSGLSNYLVSDGSSYYKYKIPKVGMNIPLPSEYKCTREVICTYRIDGGNEDIKISNINELSSGNYIINCTTGSFAENTFTSKTINVIIEEK